MLMFLTRDTMKIQSTFGIICFVDRIIFFVYQKLKKVGQTTQSLLLHAVLCQLTLEKGELRYQNA